MSVAEEKMIFRNTAAQTGRKVAVTPANSTMKHLCYGRIRLDASQKSVAFENGTHETGFVCLSGSADVKVDGATHHLAQYDSIYIPRDTHRPSLDSPFMPLAATPSSHTISFSIDTQTHARSDS